MVSPEYPDRPARPVPGLLAPEDPSPVAMLNPAASSPFLLIGDHAGKSIPKSLGKLTLTDGDLARHIACDIGVRRVGETLSALLDATFVHQIYSRLVIDCNRDPRSPDAIPEISDGTVIGGNRNIDRSEADARIAAIHDPYHRTIHAEIERRTAIGQRTILVALHSFTPVMAGVTRPWDIGILHDGGDPAFARATLAALMARSEFLTGDNEPYRMDATDHSVPRHAYPRRLPYVEVEFRQDHLAAPAGASLWAGRLAVALDAALAQGARSVDGSPGSAAIP